MGQAKHRGTFEQRRDEAIARNEAARYAALRNQPKRHRHNSLIIPMLMSAALMPMASGHYSANR